MNTKLLFVVLPFTALLSGWQQPATNTAAPTSYTLGPNDQVVVDVVELPEFHGRTYRVDADGTLDLPFIGAVPATGKTVSQLKAEVETKLRTQVRNPHVYASLSETRSQPVSVMGDVNTPGTQQMDGQRRLFDVIAGAGGLKQDAGDVITITRQANEGRLEVPNSTIDPSTGNSVAEVRVNDLVRLKDPSVNIVMRPHDSVSVAHARVLYVIGNVKKPGGFTLSERRFVSALEALSLAEGLGPNASAGNARILRKNADSDMKRQQIPVNLKRILAGKAEDIRLLPDDILYVPDNTTRRIAAKTAETALATISGIAIWRGF
jgi:polysaccharide biosynthesis/export protein